MTEVYLALGANVGDSAANIEKAISLLGEKLSAIKRAPIYQSKAVGYTNQPDFLNTAVCGQTALPPIELLGFIKQIEDRVGRVKRFRWGPREIDIDIIFYGLEILKTDKLMIPHPRYLERDFVLQPLVDLNPGLVDPSSKRPLMAFLTDLADRSILN